MEILAIDVGGTKVDMGISKTGNSLPGIVFLTAPAKTLSI